MINILLVEDTPIDAELTARALSKCGVEHRIRRVDTESAFVDALQSFCPDIILSDFSMPHFDGLDALAVARVRCPNTPFIFLSGTIGDEVAIESLRRGAVDYILKNNMSRLGTAVTRALQDSRDRQARQGVQRELQQMQDRFALFMEHLPGPAFIKDLSGRLQFVNRSFEKMSRLSSAQLLGRTADDVWPNATGIHEANDRWVEENNKVLQTFETFPESGNDRCYLVHKFPIPGDDGQPALIGGVAVDFTDRLAAEQKVARLSRIHSFLSGINATIVRVRDKKILLQEACRIAVENGGFKRAWVGLVDQTTLDVRVVASVGADPESWTIPLSARNDRPGGNGIVGRAIRDRVPVVLDDIKAEDTLSAGCCESESETLAATALPLAVEAGVVGVLVLYAGGAHVFDHDEVKLLSDLAADISFALEYLEKKERLDYIAYYDPLTGLPNRRLFGDRVGQLVNAPVGTHQRAAVVILDIERFSLINDSLGRQAGDSVLKMVGKRLRESIQATGSVARFDADAFAITIPDVREHADVARLLGERIFETMSAPLRLGTQDLRLAFKCGVAMFPGDGTETDILLRNAAIALKNAKMSGDRYLFYASAMNTSVAEVLSLENRLRMALTMKQFVLHYQPKIEAATGRVEGLEALLRWNSPEMGLVSPQQFIPILEETGMIVEVGLWVVRQAVADQQRWVAQGYRAPRVAVNVSAIQLRQKSFVKDVLIAITEAGGDASNVDLEITESVIMEDIAQYIPKLQAFRSAGMGVEIDDFGTGYSSLAYIGRLPLTAIKIDRSFVTAMSASDENASIVSTIVSLAHLLKLRVVAEGVETEDERELLAAFKCDSIQGYLVSRPVPWEKACDFLEKADRAGTQRVREPRSNISSARYDA